MFTYFRRRKAEKVLTELFLLLERTSDQLNEHILLSDEQRRAFICSSSLLKNLELTADAYNNYYVTSLSILKSLCKLLTSKELHLVVDPESDKVVAAKIG